MRFEVFSLGLCLLEAGLLESVQSVYDVNKGTFSAAKLKEFKQKFHLIYEEDSIISNYLDQLLVQNYEDRKDFVTLKSSLPSWYQMKVAIDLRYAGIGHPQQSQNIGRDPINSFRPEQGLTRDARHSNKDSG